MPDEQVFLVMQIKPYDAFGKQMMINLEVITGTESSKLTSCSLSRLSGDGFLQVR